MSKHKKLTIDEYKNFKPYQYTCKFITDYINNNNHKPEDVKILDWGCGRGREVKYYHDLGFNIFGADIDPEALENGLVNNRVFQIDENNNTEFDDNYFNIIYSNQVFEHVSDIESVAKEMHRILKPGGIGVHVFPAKFYPNEGHLHMPLVHFFPKNILRKIAIGFYVILGRHPKWEETLNLSTDQKIDLYYKYSKEKTYYRSVKEINNVFGSFGFKCDHASNSSFIDRLINYFRSRVLEHRLLVTK